MTTTTSIKGSDGFALPYVILCRGFKRGVFGKLDYKWRMFPHPLLLLNSSKNATGDEVLNWWMDNTFDFEDGEQKINTYYIMYFCATCLSLGFLGGHPPGLYVVRLLLDENVEIS